ncbi:hypothetical protein HDV00_003372 [Rhizophlyctis rosea]|nr:hypothetical protein HDV00_003372 [Rhizophlyctis rosea]
MDRAIWFAGYNYIKRGLAKSAGVDVEDTTTAINLTSSVSSSLLCMTIVNPLWVIRTRMMTQSNLAGSKTSYYYTSIPNAVQTIIKDEGFTALYKGFMPSLLGISHVAVQFPLYEKFKVILKRECWLVLECLEEVCYGVEAWWEFLKCLMEQEKDPSRKDLSAYHIFLASSASKVIASTITYPHEVLRTRLQTQPNITHIPSPNPNPYPPHTPEHHLHDLHNPPKIVPAKPKYHGLIHAIQVISKEEGLRALYKGLSTNLLRTVPASAFSLWTYEVLVQEFGRGVEEGGGREKGGKGDGREKGGKGVGGGEGGGLTGEGGGAEVKEGSR